MGAQWGNTGPKQDWKPAGQTLNCISMSDVKMLLRSPTPSNFSDCKTSFLLSCFHFELVVFLGRYPMSLTHPTSWGLFTASQNGFSTRPTFRDTSDLCLAPAVFLGFSLTLNPEHGLLVQLHLHQLPVFDGYLRCLRCGLVELSIALLEKVHHYAGRFWGLLCLCYTKFSSISVAFRSRYRTSSFFPTLCVPAHYHVLP